MCLWRGDARLDDLLLVGVSPDDSKRWYGADDGQRASASSHKLRPVIVRHQVGARPLLAIGIGTIAGEETVLRMFENGNPR